MLLPVSVSAVRFRVDAETPYMSSNNQQFVFDCFCGNGNKPTCEGWHGLMLVPVGQCCALVNLLRL